MLYAGTLLVVRRFIIHTPLQLGEARTDHDRNVISLGASLSRTTGTAAEILAPGFFRFPEHEGK